MRIVVVGAGALGCLVGGLLARARNPVVLVGRPPQTTAIRRHGLHLSGLTRTRLRLPAVERVPPGDLFLVTVKSYDTPAAARSIPPGDSPVLTLQNGLGNAETLRRLLGPRRVLAGTTSLGALQMAPGRIHHTGQGPTRVGEWDGRRSSRVLRIASLLRETGLESTVSTNIEGDLWAKLAVNAAINPLTALLRVPNGALLQPGLRPLLDAIAREVAGVARAEGHPLLGTTRRVLQVARRTSRNRSSMLQDMDRGSPTEIEAINGEVVRRGERHTIPTPVNRALRNLLLHRPRPNLYVVPRER